MYIPTQLQKLIFSATSKVYIPSALKPVIGLNIQKPLNLLLKLTKQDYVVTNPKYLFSLSEEDFNKVETQVFSILNSQTITAYKLRDSFGKSVNLERYTAEEQTVIFAQYSITYGWQDLFEDIVNNSPVSVINNYSNKYDFSTLVKVQTTKLKEITFIGNNELAKYIKSIMEADILLRKHQIEILKVTPTDILQQHVNYKIKATEALVNNILYQRNIQPNFSSLDALMRFILANGQQGNNEENYDQQILKDSLKSFKFHLPTKMKKMIWFWLNNQYPQKIAEQMFKYEQWWKRCLHHAQWCSSSKFIKRYPIAKRTLDLLYSSDRSWTFNARYEKALQNNNYKEAVEILSEKSGMLFRNLIMLCKYTKGVNLPIKDKVTAKNQKMYSTTDLLFSLRTKPKVVVEDAATWLLNELPEYIEKTKPSIKLLWQVLEELVDTKHEKPMYKRMIQGKEINYSTPIPAINKKLRNKVINILKLYIQNVKQKDNKSLGKVYLDPKLDNIAIQYSGAKSTEMSCSGSFLTQGSSFQFPFNAKFIRLGVAWTNTGNGSCDIDLSTGAYNKNRAIGICYYGHPELEVYNNLIAVSSGDITSCKSDIYSAEFIDIDLKKAKQSNIQYFINYLNMYSGKTFNKYDTHLFVSFIKAEDRVIPRNRMTIDLAKQDYAIKITEPAKGYIGALLDLETKSCKILNLNAKTLPYGSNIVNSKEAFKVLLNNLPDRLKIYKVLKYCINLNQLVTKQEDADVSIGISTNDTINITTNMEEVNKLIF